jgi:hypothetical protein
MSVEDLAKQAADSVRQVIAEAQKQAAEIIAAAEKEAEGIRARAEAEARDQVEGARRALEELTARFGSQGAAPPPPPAPAPPAARPSPPAPTPPEPEAAVADEPEPAPPASEDDSQAARLVAMKMALDGASREEIDAELEGSYTLADRDALLDEILAKAGK